MTIGQELLHKLTLEAAVTRRFLEHLPFDRLDFKPTEKSENLGRLGIHIAEITAWWVSVVETESLDFIDFEPKDVKSREKLLDYFDDLLAEANNPCKKPKTKNLKKSGL